MPNLHEMDRFDLEIRRIMKKLLFLLLFLAGQRMLAQTTTIDRIDGSKCIVITDENGTTVKHISKQGKRTEENFDKKNRIKKW